MRKKPKLLILGHMRHGKDTAAEKISELMGLSFASSSVFAGTRAVFPWWGKERYNSFDECFEDRVNFRKTWGDLIDAYTTPDKSRLTREMFESGLDMYVGQRRREEYNACMEARLFDLVIWVDRSDHLPPEPSDSMEMDQLDAEFILDNNGDLNDLEAGIIVLQQHLQSLGFDVAGDY